MIDGEVTWSEVEEKTEIEQSLMGLFHGFSPPGIFLTKQPTQPPINNQKPL
jgi:hypothetical protein